MTDSGDSEAGTAGLLMIGYIPLQPFGYALACYGSAANANSLYTARCSTPGDHKGLVTGFERLDDPGMAALPETLHRRVVTGSPWPDVFLWDGEVFVGTSEELSVQLSALMSDVAKRAPMTGFDLIADETGDDDRRGMAEAAVDYLTARYGDAMAASWVSETASSRLAVLAARHGVNATTTEFEIRLSSNPGTDLIEVPATATAVGRDVFLAAASALASDLGVFITATPKGPMATTTTPWNASAEPAARVLVVTAGHRAQEIADAARPLEWTPSWGDNAMHQSWLLDGGPATEDAGPPGGITVHVRPFDAPTQEQGFTAVVVLVDDEIAGDAIVLRHLADIGRRHSAKGAAVILAPALPRDGPSVLLTAPPSLHADLNLFDFVLDTSVVRSPLRTSRRRLSLERKVADHAFGIATILGLGAPLNRWTGRIPGEEIRLITFVLHQTASALDSESHVDIGRAPLFGEVFAVTARGAHTPETGSLTVVRQNLDFEAFAWATLRSGRETALEKLRAAPSLLPDDVRAAFSAPSMAAGFRFSAGPELCLVAEAPSLPALRQAADLGWVVIRYTDTLAINRFFTDEGARRPGFLPDDISVPPFARLASNRRLATRGVDPRDAVILSRSAWSKVVRGRRTALEPFVRPYVERIETADHPDRLVFPLSAAVDLVPADAVCRDLEAAGMLGAVRAKRTEDLNAAWRSSAEGSHRYVIDDGRLPPRVTALTKGHVPAQGFFLLDGDASAAALFRSRVFEVWARATRSKGTGWMPRFAMTGTFETFPVPTPFVISWTGPTRDVRLAPPAWEKGELAALAAAPVSAGQKIGNDDGQLDREILRIYELAPSSTDLDILHRLIELSGELNDS